MIPARSSKRHAPRYFLPLILFASVVTACMFGLRATHGQSTTPGIKTDRGVYAEPALPARPAAGGKFRDAVFGSEIMRATDESDGPAPGLGTFYSHWPTFNSDSTRLLIRKGVTGEAIVKGFDPVNFELTGTSETLPAALPGGGGPNWESATWSTKDSDVIYTFSGYFYGGMKLYTYNVRTKSFTLIKDLGFLGGEKDYLRQMYMSEDEDTFCWIQLRAGANNGQPIFFVVYRRSVDKVLYHVDATQFVGGVNEVHVDKSGHWLHVVIPTKQSDGTGTRILNLETGKYQAFTKEVDHTPGHGDLGRGTIIGNDNYEDGISYRSLDNIHVHNQALTFKTADGVLDWTNGFHGSMLADDESWIVVGTYDEPGANSLPDSHIFEDEIMQVSLDGSQGVRRLCHTRTFVDSKSDTTGYWAMPKPTISRDGRYIAFTSNWENSGRYDLFILKVETDGSTTPNPTPTPTPTPTPAPELVSPPLVATAQAEATALAAAENISAAQIDLLAQSIQQAYNAFYNESARFASAAQIDNGLRAALYFSRAAAALTRADAPASGIQSRLQIAAAKLAQVTNLMQDGGGSAALAHATTTAAPPVIGVGDIRSSASFAPAVSPGSLATILGDPAVSPLAGQTANAALAADGSLPYELTGISVTVAGRAAPVIAVSPSRVSFYIPADVATGNIEFLVTSQDGLVSRGTAHVASATAVPAIFTADGSGTGAGLVLNTATHLRGSFDVTTEANFGTDKRTRLMIMTTGISAGAVNSNAANDVSVGPVTLVNLAESVRVEARTGDGRTFRLPVEYAGLSGSFPGLEQVNVVLVPELKGAGEVDLTIIVGSARSNAASVSVR